MICKAVAKGSDVAFTAPITSSYNIDDIIEEDKKYGIFKPKNGEYFTYKVLNEDEEITNKQVLKSIQYSYRRISLRTNLKFRRARKGEYADFKIDFRTVDTDPEKQLTPSTLMYHYFPINDPNNGLRGLCVVNKDYFWTTSGKSLDMHHIDPEHYPEKGSGYIGKTYDFDQVYCHEVLHGLGLPHSKGDGHMMSPNYGIMGEWLSEEDIKRLQAKYGVRVIKERLLNRWLAWLFRASER